ncbi:Protein kinase, ATP binding site-containing protein [Cynara cardunculus var. scolymus]|uniref:Protein kinase, ATP binding site-containing protein n=1 Tax=Cynara cardunculus var. scolymus TaxID=59895 RepID=A0A103XLP6_CYNCS|nr:Protein kinase, ATP binding site-containing protein [Cynara cardunculus var. scolymus]
MDFHSYFCCLRGFDRKQNKKKQSTWRIFSLKELHSATNNFNYDNKLGEGGFGSVYWGQLWDGSQIAVKRLKVWSNKAEMEFAVEVEILARVRHKNLLSLRGYCAEGQERLIVYDYMPNLSLLSHLHGQHSAECLLDWNRRMTIAIGSAEGIVEIADPKLNGNYSADEMKRVSLVGLICARNQPDKRPTILEVVELLKGESKEKVDALENDDMFCGKHDYNDGVSVADDSCDSISVEKAQKEEIEKVVGI